MRYLLIISAVLTGTLSVRVPVSWNKEDKTNIVPPDRLRENAISNHDRSSNAGVTYSNSDWIPIPNTAKSVQSTSKPTTNFLWGNSKIPAQNRQFLQTPSQVQLPVRNIKTPHAQGLATTEFNPTNLYSRPIVLSTNVQPRPNAISSESGYSKTKVFPEREIHDNKNIFFDANNNVGDDERSTRSKQNYLKKLQEQPQKIFQAITQSYNLPSSIAPVQTTKKPSAYEDLRSKNYRDDTLHEPLPYDVDKANSDREDRERLREDAEEEGEDIEEETEQEDENLPTRPIYPGEGVWAKRGQDYRKYVPPKPLLEGVVPNNPEAETAEQSEAVENDAEPDGHKIFEDLEQFFDQQRHKFDESFSNVPSGQLLSQATNTPADVSRISGFVPVQATEEQRTVPNIVYDPFGDTRQYPQHRRPVQVGIPQQTLQRRHQQVPSIEEGGEENEEEFVPVKLYTQVRKTENEEHLPPDPAEGGRLKEVIKDSVVRTVYSEEGYEDSAYDHAGHEKKAEKDEGFAQFKKDVENKEEKRHTTEPPKLKTPKDKVYSSKFKSEDYDANKLIKQKLEFNDDDDDEEDAEPAATHVVSGNNFNQIKPDSKSKPYITNNYSKSKETKLMSVKDKENGKGQEMEISSEVKVIIQPNNSTKKQKFVKIYPKIYKDLDKDKQKDSIVISTTTEKNLNKTITKKSVNTIFTDQVSATIQATTEMPKVRVRVLTTTEKSKVKVRAFDSDPLDQTSEVFESLKIRKKRFTDDIEIDTDFIDKINHTLPPIRKENTEAKYPYYKSTILPENSPLRYGENLENVPVKYEGKMSFYTRADSKPCPSIPTNVNPIPERIENAKPHEEDEESEEAEEDDSINSRTPKTPRLEGLGDKIDCLKVRYFGTNPLDSPLFKEEIIAPPKSIFPELAKPNQQIAEIVPLKQSSNIAENIIKTEHLESKEETKPHVVVVPQITTTSTKSTTTTTITTTTTTEKTILTTTQPTTIPAVTNTTTASTVSLSVAPNPVVTLITTPKYTIDFKPKNIYDQIKLLKYLPDNGTFQEQNVMENIERLDIAKEISELETPREPKYLNVQEESLPDQQALRARKKQRRPTQKPSMTTNYGIFDVTKFWPTHHHVTEASTVLPKYKIVSEVFYKDEIKPNEQLNVFADVLNNIKNSTAQEKEQSQQISVKLNTVPPNVPQVKNKIKKYQKDSSHYVNSVDIRQKPTTSSPKYEYDYTDEAEEYIAPSEKRNTPRDSIQYIKKHHKLNNKNIESEINENYPPVKNPKWATNPLSQYPEEYDESTTSRILIDYIEESHPILGLLPPPQVNQKYHTIILPPIHILPPVTVTEAFRPSPAIFSITESAQTQTEGTSSPPPIYDVSEKVEDLQMNRFFYVGMKPPPKQKVVLYSDFLKNNLVGNRRNGFVKRMKRDTNRRSYSAVSRNRGRPKEDTTVKAETTQSAEDDYVPKRTRNWHYDEKTGKIVYDKKSEPEKDEEEEVEYIEIEESPATYKPEKVKDAATTKPLLATATPPPEGQGFIDFVAKLKNNPNYKFIPDPTTTEKGKEPITEKITAAASTMKAESTKPPEFLSILSKVKEDSSYKLIEDPSDKKKKKTVTTEATETAEADEDGTVEESRDAHVNDAPELEIDDASKLKIFDIGQFLPKVNYMPKTSVDYSKYKTIERPTSKPNPRDRYDDEEESVREASKPEEVKERQISTTLASSTASTSTVRSRTRSRSRLTTLKSNPRIETETTPVPFSSDTHAPAKRNYRRRPQRIRQKTTTEKYVDEEEEAEESRINTKSVRRRSERGTRFVENLHSAAILEKPVVVEQNSSTAKIQSLGENKKNATVFISNSGSIDPRKLNNVEIMKKVDTKKRHGGNYKSEDEIIEKAATNIEVPPFDSGAKIEEIKSANRKRRIEPNKDITKLPDIVVEDSIRVARVVTLSNGIKTKNAVSDTKAKDVEVVEKYNPKKKHGGNYKSEEEVLEKELLNESNEQLNDETEINLEESGNNSKNDVDIENDENSSIRVARIATVGNRNKNVIQNIKSKDVELTKKYDPKKKHGGNYKSEDELIEEEETEEESSEELLRDPKKSKKLDSPRITRVASVKGVKHDKNVVKDVDIIKAYDVSKKHGGNYKSEDEVIHKEISEEMKPKQKLNQNIQENKDVHSEDRKFEVNHVKSTNLPVQRLVDAVRKPEDFYTDPHLPKQVNQMEEQNKNIHIEELILEEETDNNDDEAADELKRQERKVNFSVERTKLLTTKKPVIIKDPSKRLYYYAPV